MNILYTNYIGVLWGLKENQGVDKYFFVLNY